MTPMPPDDATPSVWHKSLHRIPLYEVDMGQAVYHGGYYHFFELARESFFREIGYPYSRLMENEKHFTIVEASCVYRRPLRYNELIEIRTGLRWRRNRSLSLAQDVHLLEGEGAPALCTTAVLNMVCVNFSGRPTTIPKEFIECLDGWMDRT
jgi:acyl-CoA thioester hydrolase